MFYSSRLASSLLSLALVNSIFAQAPRQPTDQSKTRFSGSAFATPYTPDLSPADKVAGLSRLWAEARYGFANFWHVPTLDWDQTYRDFLPQVANTQSTAAYYRVLAHFYALLQDGHTNVYPPGEIDEGRLPLRTRIIEGHVLVVGTRDPQFDMQGARIGDEVLAINGLPVRDYAATTIAPFVSASTPQDRDNRTFDTGLLVAAVGTPLTLTMTDATGHRSTRTFIVPPYKPTHRTAFEYRQIGDIAYVALRSFEDDNVAVEFDRHYAEIAKARAVILDIRENGGGDDSVGARILKTFLRRPAQLARSQSPQYVATALAWGDNQSAKVYPPEMLDPDPVRHFDGPLILLTGPRTFSAAEDFAVVFVQAHRGTIVGEPTGGSTGQPLSFKLPGGGSARVCTKHDSFADGTEFVGLGVQPDILVHPTVESTRAGGDPVLSAALIAAEVPSTNKLPSGSGK